MRKKLFALPIVAAFLNLMLSFPVYASSGGDEVNADIVIHETGNAVEDIMSGDRFQGSIGTIAPVVDFIDKYGIMLISISAFLIITGAMLKNVLAGVYCTNPKLWDKVSEAHQTLSQANMSAAISKLKGFQEIKPADIGTFLFGIIPNVKAWTDFAEEDGKNIDPKAYFMKSIPNMIICCLIGTFIYNGYYRDTAAVTLGFGAEMFSQALAAADPVGLANRMFNMTGTPDCPSDLLTTRAGKLQNTITHKAYSVILTKFTDITTVEAKAQMITAVDEQSASIVKNLDKYLDEGADANVYTWSVQAKLVTSEIAKQDPKYQAGQDANSQATVSYAVTVPLADCGITSNVNVPYTHIGFRINGTRNLKVEIKRDGKGSGSGSKSKSK